MCNQNTINIITMINVTLHQARGIFMGLVLFNGALMRNQNTINLFWDESKLQRYIDKWEYFCLTVFQFHHRVFLFHHWVSLCTTSLTQWKYCA